MKYIRAGTARQRSQFNRLQKLVDAEKLRKFVGIKQFDPLK